MKVTVLADIRAVGMIAILAVGLAVEHILFWIVLKFKKLALSFQYLANDIEPSLFQPR